MIKLNVNDIVYGLKIIKFYFNKKCFYNIKWDINIIYEFFFLNICLYVLWEIYLN